MKIDEVRKSVGCKPKQCDRTKVDGECFCEYAARVAPDDISKEELVNKFLNELMAERE